MHSCIVGCISICFRIAVNFRNSESLETDANCSPPPLSPCLYPPKSFDFWTSARTCVPLPDSFPAIGWTDTPGPSTLRWNNPEAMAPKFPNGTQVSQRACALDAHSCNWLQNAPLMGFLFFPGSLPHSLLVSISQPRWTTFIQVFVAGFASGGSQSKTDHKPTLIASESLLHLQPLEISAWLRLPLAWIFIQIHLLPAATWAFSTQGNSVHILAHPIFDFRCKKIFSLYSRGQDGLVAFQQGAH